jgi:hypothetical protein
VEVALTEVLSETEGEPAARPNMDAVLGPATLDFEVAAWERLETWTAYRFGERQVVWIVEGPGIWRARLRPATVDSVEVWRDSAWTATTANAAPLGLELQAETYRLTATVGDTGDPPQGFMEAYRRLVEFMAAIEQEPAPAHSSGQDGDYSFTRPAGWAAKAIHLSGAADLLRGYR